MLRNENTVIEVEKLYKQYKLGETIRYDTLRDQIVGIFQRNKPAVNHKPATIWALQDISFKLKQGEVLGIIGRNGAGKSTLLKILSRITKPTQGSIKIRGRVGSLLEVGTGFHSELTGRENVYMNAAILGMTREEIKRRFDDIVDFAEVEKFIDTPIKRYSSGMQLRLAFAVAAHIEPEILIVDEVLAVGDVAFQRKCLGKMSDVAGEGRTVLFVSHNLAAVQRLCTKTMWLDHGRIMEIGSTSGVIHHYLNAFSDNEQASVTFERPTENLPAWVCNIRFESEDGNLVKEVPIGKPWQLRVRVKSQQDVEHFIVGLGLLTMDNVPVRLVWSEPVELSPGEYEYIFCENEIMLGSGQYSISIGLSSYERTFQYLESAGYVTIAQVTEVNEILRAMSVVVMNPMSIAMHTLTENKED